MTSIQRRHLTTTLLHDKHTGVSSGAREADNRATHRKTACDCLSDLFITLLPRSSCWWLLLKSHNKGKSGINYSLCWLKFTSCGMSLRCALTRNNEVLIFQHISIKCLTHHHLLSFFSSFFSFLLQIIFVFCYLNSSPSSSVFSTFTRVAVLAEPSHSCILL